MCLGNAILAFVNRPPCAHPCCLLFLGKSFFFPFIGKKYFLLWKALLCLKKCPFTQKEYPSKIIVHSASQTLVLILRTNLFTLIHTRKATLYFLQKRKRFIFYYIRQPNNFRSIYLITETIKDGQQDTSVKTFFSSFKLHFPRKLVSSS